MIPTACSQLAEQLARSCFWSGSGHALLPQGLEYAAAAASFSAAVGAFAASVYWC